MSILAVPLYAAARPILNLAPVKGIMERLSRSPSFGDTLNAEGTGLLVDKIRFAAVLYLCTFVLVSLPAALLGVLLYRFLRDMGLGVGWAVAVTFIYGLATTAYPYSGAFLSHQFVAVLCFTAFYIARQVRQGRISPAWTIAAGFLLGYAVVSEYPAALIVAGVGLYVLFALPQKRWALPFILAGVPPVLMLAGYNLAIFHTPLPVGYAYSELYTQEHSQGLVSLTYPHLEALWGVTFGSFRGLFFGAPVLVLAVAGFVGWWRSGRLCAELIVCVWATFSFFMFNGSSVMWSGGFGVGPRYLVPMLPFFALGLGAFALRWGDRSWVRLLTLGLAVYSFAVVWAQTLGGQSYPDWTPNPLINYTLPRLVQGDIARNLGMIVNLRGWVSLLPLAILMTAIGAWLTRRIATREFILSFPGARPDARSATGVPRQTMGDL